ncbi:MAG TPA: hypothetical protein VI457_00970 [Methylococcaceae bacterium]|nr:hypothetical protein [Methylococcaceae bacterium]
MADPSTSLGTGIDIVHETAGLKPLRPADAELAHPPRRKAGKKPAGRPPAQAEPAEPGESPPADPDEPPRSVDTYA